MDAWGDGFVSARMRDTKGIKGKRRGRRARMRRGKKGMAIEHCIGVLGKEAISMISVDIYRLLLTWCRTG